VGGRAAVKVPERWLAYVRRFSEAFSFGRAMTCGLEIEPRKAEVGAPQEDKGLKPTVLICSPHPDDESLTGALGLALKGRRRARVVNLLMTLGSLESRREARLREALAACDILGFTNTLSQEPWGFAELRPDCRRREPERWGRMVAQVTGHLDAVLPDIVCVPHLADAHPAHRGTALLVAEALTIHSAKRNTGIVAASSGFWRQLNSPNLMVGLDDSEMALLVAGAAAHTGEVTRNPYHLRQPARCMDNVRLGGELMAGVGGTPPSFCFGELYELALYEGGRRHPWQGPGLLYPPESAMDLLARIRERWCDLPR